MIEFIKNTEDKVMNGIDITYEESLKLSKVESEEELKALYASANKIRERFCGNQVDLCSIMNAKSGNCSEDCKFCAQSSHYDTEVEVYDLVSKKEAIDLAKETEDEGVNRFSLVTSGKGISEKDFESVVEIYEDLNNSVKINLCASLGILGKDQFDRLKQSGITMYHHNLETSRDYYKEICTTHKYEDRIETINHAKSVGMAVCSGGIIGMGESLEDRIKLAFELKNLGVKSIPINVLNSVKGTPLENVDHLSQAEILKTVSIFRLVNPKSFIRLAGGRNMIDDFGKACFNAGANATITGNYLTTSGNKICDDKMMINSLNLQIRKNA